jgi:hypothetical protein
MKKFFKSLAGGFVMVVGTLGLYTFGWTGLHFKHEIKGNDVNYHRIHDKAGMVAVVGDPGLLSAQRASVLKALTELCVSALEKGQNFTTIYPGDLQYKYGTTSDQDHETYIRPLWPLCPAHKYAFATLGNHGLLAFQGQDYMAKRYHGQPVQPGMNLFNYYWAAEFDDQMFLFNESTIYDAWIDPPIEARQEAFDQYAIARAKVTPGLPINYVAHHPFFTSSKRKPTDDYMDFYDQIRKKINNVFVAHDHLLWWKNIDGVNHYVSGMGSKTTTGPLGFVFIDADGSTKASYVQGDITPAGEEEE